MMRRYACGLLVILSLLVLVACNSATAVPSTTATPAPTATPNLAREGWELVWHDEFAEPAINPAFWTHEIGGNGWGNGESQYYTDSADNSFIDDGYLVIQALEQNYKGKLFTSARLITKDKVEQTYGRFEARIQIPTGQGIWPAFWLLGADIDEVSWPQSGEIDIMENIGREPNVIHGTVHGPGYAGGDGIGNLYRLRGTERFADAVHEFAIEWEPDEIRWYVDDIEYNRLQTDRVPGEWVFDHPFFILLNVAVGGQWPGYPDDTTTFPQQLLVDYVRIYEKSSGE